MGGGGAGMRGGGAHYGGYSGGAASRSPSMSRPYHSSSYSGPHMTSPSVGSPSHTPGGSAARVSTRPETGRIPGTQPGQKIAGEASRPTKDQVQQFLHLPQDQRGGKMSDLAKVGAGVAAGALGAEGARELLEGRHPGDRERPTQLPETPGLGGRLGTGDRVGPGERPAHLPVKPAADNVRANLKDRYDHVFTPDWWRDHPNAARAYWNNFGKYHWEWNHWWRPATWAALVGWTVGAAAAGSYGDPIYYDYGQTVYYEDGDVYVSGSKVATEEEYYQQANTLASNAPDTTAQEGEDWLPLGVFALSQANAPDSSMVLQLAVNKDGVIGGTYYNAINNTVRPIKGQVDPKSQRAAWTFADGKNTDIITETGIYNLTLDQTEALVHFGTDITQQWLMVRLNQPESQKSAEASAQQ